MIIRGLNLQSSFKINEVQMSELYYCLHPNTRFGTYEYLTFPSRGPNTAPNIFPKKLSDFEKISVLTKPGCNEYAVTPGNWETCCRI